MTESPFREKHYRTEEVRAVVRQALSNEAQPSGGRPLTRDEVEQMLSDLGVSERVAARALDEGEGAAQEDASDEEGFFGGPRRIVFEGEVDGELLDDRREDVVEIIREEMGDQGRVESLGRTVTWAPTPVANNGQRRLSVKVRARDGGTRVRVDEDLVPLLAGIWAGFGFGGGLGLGALAVVAGKLTGSVAVGILTFLLIVALNLFAARLTARAVSRGRRRDLRKLFGRVRGEVMRSVSPAPRVAESKGTGARLRRVDTESASAERQAEQEAAAEEEAESEGSGAGTRRAR